MPSTLALTLAVRRAFAIQELWTEIRDRLFVLVAILVLANESPVEDEDESDDEDEIQNRFCGRVLTLAATPRRL